MRYETAALRVKHALINFAIIVNAGFGPGQPRDERGRWSDGGGDGSGNSPKRETGDPKIDRTTEILVETATDVANSVKNLKGAVFGTAVHYQFAQAVRNLNLPGIGRMASSRASAQTIQYDMAWMAACGLMSSNVTVIRPMHLS